MQSLRQMIIYTRNGSHNMLIDWLSTYLKFHDHQRSRWGNHDPKQCLPSHHRHRTEKLWCLYPGSHRGLSPAGSNHPFPYHHMIMQHPHLSCLEFPRCLNERFLSILSDRLRSRLDCNCDPLLFEWTAIGRLICLRNRSRRNIKTKVWIIILLCTRIEVAKTHCDEFDAFENAVRFGP